MNYQYQERSRRHKRSSLAGNLVKVFSFVIIVSLLFMTSLFLLKSLQAQSPTRIQGKIISPIVEEETEEAVDNTALTEVVRNSLENTSGRYGVAIKNFQTGEEYYQDEHLVFEAASLYKLWVMLTVFDQMKAGKFDEATAMKSDVEELNKRFNIASEAAELKEGEVGMTVGDAMNRMITVSHNYAALLLSAKVRLSNVNTQLIKHNLSESTLNPPKTTAYDTLKFYELLYNNDLIDKEYSEEMLDLLTRQQLNDRIPKYLPENVTVAHKTGELDGFKHDAGIVFSPKGDYIIVILSRSEDPKGAAEREAILSRDVYNYFQRK